MSPLNGIYVNFSVVQYYTQLDFLRVVTQLNEIFTGIKCLFNSTMCCRVTIFCRYNTFYALILCEYHLHLYVVELGAIIWTRLQ